MKELLRKVKNRIVPSLLGKLGRWIIWLIMKTCSVRVYGESSLCCRSTSTKGILVLWHDKLLIIPELLNQVTHKQTFAALVSNSRDGQLLASLIESYKRGRSIRVASHERHEALHKLIKHLKVHDDVVVITPDGPRGPKAEVKKGTIFAAEKSGTAIIPVAWSANRCWELPTWDKMLLPKPFSTVHLSFGPTIQPTSANSELSQQGIKDSLDTLSLFVASKVSQ